MISILLHEIACLSTKSPAPFVQFILGNVLKGITKPVNVHNFGHLVQLKISKDDLLAQQRILQPSSAILVFHYNLLDKFWERLSNGAVTGPPL